MKMELTGSEAIAASRQTLWDGLTDPGVLAKCIPGCKAMTETGPDAYDVEMQLKVAAVGGSFRGKVILRDKQEPDTCRMTLTGGGTLGTGNGSAEFTITEVAPDVSRLDYSCHGEIGGLVAGVGQRVLGSVSRHLARQFFANLQKHYQA